MINNTPEWKIAYSRWAPEARLESLSATAKEVAVFKDAFQIGAGYAAAKPPERDMREENRLTERALRAEDAANKAQAEIERLKAENQRLIDHTMELGKALCRNMRPVYGVNSPDVGKDIVDLAEETFWRHRRAGDGDRAALKAARAACFRATFVAAGRSMYDGPNGNASVLNQGRQ